MKPSISFLLVAVCIAGCASNSGVIPLGQNRYMINSQQATGFPGLGNLTAENIAAGTAHCSKQGLQFELVNITESQPPYIFGNYPRSEVRFLCTTQPITPPKVEKKSGVVGQGV